MYQSSVRSTTAGTAKTVLAIVATLSLLLSFFAVAGPVMAQGGGEADCPAGTTRLINLDQGDIEVGDELVTGVFVRAVTREDGDSGQLTSVTIENTTSENVTIAVKGGSDQTGNFVTIAPGATETITVTNNPTISNLTVCQGPEIVENDETVTVIKDLVGDTAGTFDLLINGSVEAAGVGDGGTTGAVVTDEGSVTVSETGANGTDLANYTSSISCMAGETEVASGSGTSLEFTLEDDQDVVCTITNTLIVPDTGDLKVVKYFCEGTNDPQVVFVPLEKDATLPNLEDCVEGDATFTINGGNGLRTTDGVLLVNDLPVGTHTLAETDPNQASTDFEIVANTETVIYVLDFEEQPDQGEIQIDKFFCPTEGEDRVEFEIRGPITPLNEGAENDCTVGAGVTFIVTPIDPAGDAFEVTTGDNGTIRFDVDAGSYTVTEKSTGETSEVFTVEAGSLMLVIVKNFEGEEDQLGSITINKEVACEVCQTFTPGYYFNGNEQTPGFADAMRLLEANGGIQIDGWDFMTVQDVLDQTEPGSLLRHTLALQLNVWLAEENDCDLSSVVFNSEGNEFDGQTVGDILAAALDILASGDPAFAESGNGGYADLHEAIDLINNASHTDDGTLTCEGTSAGAGFMFELYGPDDPELLADSGTTDESGMLTFSDLAFGTYTLVETGGSGEEECSIVSASGDGVTFDPETGVITIVIDETNTDVTVTVVNECGGESGGETGSITIIKNAVPDAAQDFAFTTSANLTGFSLDDDADATLANQETFTGLLAGSYSVAESMTAGWTLTSITCSAGGTADLASRTANITLAEGADVTCTFVNTQEGQQTETGSITILKNAVPDDAQDFVFTTTGTGLSGFSLDDDANATLSNQKTFSGLAAGMYTVAEGSVTGWTLTSLTCSPSTAVSVTGSMASITLAAGANVTCTFVNTKQGSGTLPNQGGPKTGEGTLAGQLPNTATEPFNGTSMPVALVALLMLSGLGAAAYAMKADSARRR